MNGKNILVLAPTPSHPQDAGNRKRIYALTKYLQELGATIYFVYCPREWDREIPQDSYGGMQKCWDYFFVAYPVQRAVHQTDNEYFEIDAWWDVGIEFTINWIKLAVDIDMVFCNYVFYSKVLELFDESVTKVIDTHDIVSNRNYLLEKKLGYRDFFFTSPKSEREALNRAHLVLSIKEDESSWFKCLSPTPVLTIGHLEPEPDEIKQRKIEYSNIKLGFIGSANPINCKNLESFLDEYFSTYGEDIEQFTFVIGGKICQVLNTRFHDKVHLLGMVDDVSEFYEQIDIVVLPFEFSTGLKIKTVEALSWEKPCIGTINAFEGLGSNCHYHSFKSIKNLAHGIKDLISDPQSVIAQLQQDSESVRTNYANKVKSSIQKLYNVNWQSVKELQIAANPSVEQKSNPEPKKIYNFNLVTNIDFWKSNSNEASWINFWIDNAKQLGNVHIYRTKDFLDIANDKQILYRQGLVNNVHHRELYQILDLFKIAPDEDRIFINLIDFSSVVLNNSCLAEIEQIQLADNHYLWCFFNQSGIENSSIEKYIRQILTNTSGRLFDNYLWDGNNSFISEFNAENIHINLLDNPLKLDSSSDRRSLELDRVVIGTSCTDQESLSQLKKIALCCRDFLPDNFELVIISDLELVKSNYHNVYSNKDAKRVISRLDLFVCIEEPKTISFLIYLCFCRSIFITYRDNSFANALVGNLSMPIKGFTSIPEVYESCLKISVFEKAESSIVHESWQLFIDYWLHQTLVQHNIETPKLVNNI